MTNSANHYATDGEAFWCCVHFVNLLNLICGDRRIELIFWHGIDEDFLRPIVDCHNEIQVSTKIWVLPSRIYAKPRTWKFSPQHTIITMCYQFSSTKVDASSVINWTIISQWYKTIIPAAFDNKFIPAIVHLCLQQEPSVVTYGFIHDSCWQAYLLKVLAKDTRRQYLCCWLPRWEQGSSKTRLTNHSQDFLRTVNNITVLLIFHASAR